MKHKAIAITIKPQHLVNILNGTKTLEIRKNKALYNAIKKMIAEKGKATIVAVCSKGNTALFYNWRLRQYWTRKARDYRVYEDALNGKVVCKWECDRVEELYFYDEYATLYLETEIKYFYKKCCLNQKDLFDYLGFRKGYAIPIQNLVVFERAKELKELKHLIGYWHFGCLEKPIYVGLEKAPQNYAWVEVEE